MNYAKNNDNRYYVNIIKIDSRINQTLNKIKNYLKFSIYKYEVSKFKQYCKRTKIEANQIFSRSHLSILINDKKYK